MIFRAMRLNFLHVSFFRHCDFSKLTVKKIEHMGPPGRQPESILIDCSGPATMLVRGRGRHKEIDFWEQKHGPYLLSAMVAGQWTQTRRCSVPSFNVTDNRCQLCREQPGTIQHRFECSATRPPKGWPEEPSSTKLVTTHLSPQRRAHLYNRGFLVLRVPKPPAIITETFAWFLPPPEDVDDATWYLDGSMLHREFYDLRATGFAIVVVSKSRGLVGLGGGTPPWWCRTAAAAEAWALQVALGLCEWNSQLRTDCESLLTIAEAGLISATMASKPLARIWAMVGQHLDGDIVSIVTSQRLVWLPAHLTTSAISNRWLSNGKRFTVVDWRANRLADMVAKLTADGASPPKRTVQVALSGLKASRHAAAKLGLVTFAANNHEVVETDAQGKTHTKHLRDAQEPAPASKPPKRAESSTQVPHEQLTAPGALPRECKAWGEDEERPQRHKLAAKWQAAGREHAKRARLEEDSRVRARADEVAATLSSRPGKVPGSTRLAELERRVAARVAKL